MRVTKKLLYIFLFLTLSFSIVSAENACTNTDGNYTFNEDNISTSFSGITLSATQSDYYYFDVETAGTITIEFTSNPAGKILMDSSESSCVNGNNGVSDIITITKSSAFDFNLGLYATQDSTYAFTVTFVPAPLSITKTVFPTQVEENNETQVTYTIDIINNSETDLSTVNFTDDLPFDASDITNIAYDDSDWSCNLASNDAPYASSNLECNLTTLVPGDLKTFTINVNVDTDSDIVNTAYIKASTTETFDDTATVEAVTSSGTVDLEIQKFAEADTIPPGRDFVYAIFVTNHTQGKDAHLVTVTDVFPSPEETNVTFVSYDRGSGWDCNISNPSDPGFTSDPGTFTCRFDRSMGHEITYFTITAHTAEGDYYIPEVNNTASVTALNPISYEHDTTDTATISIGDANITGGVIGGVYAQNGFIEASTVALELDDSRSDAYLQTKVASDIDTIGVYMMNGSHYVDQYQDITSIEGNNKLIPLTVILKLGTDGCRLMDDPSLTYNPDHRAVAVFHTLSDWHADAEDSVNGGGSFNLRNIATKKARIIMQYLDINALLDDANETCRVSSIDGNIKGLPQCLTNAAGSNKFDNNKYINTFGIDAFVRCAIQNGQPCNSSNGGYGDDPYDSEYGCYECTLGSSGSCSKDNFAIRPKIFDVNISDYINVDGDIILTAGKEYDLGFEGLTAIADENTIDYNETQIPPGQVVGPLESDTFHLDANVTNNTNCEVKYLKNDPLVSFQDGLGVQGPIKFDDIGDINFTIHETNGTEFAIVDQNDTLLEDRLIDEFNINFDVIPDHFYVDANLTDHNTDANFTYLHDTHLYDSEDNYAMASTFTVDIAARGEDNDTTSNYIEGCYAKETNLTLALNGTDIIYPGSEPAIKHFLYYNPLEDDGSPDSGEGNVSLPISSPISDPLLSIENDTTSFPEGGYNDINGTTHIEYKLNFDRKVHLVVNPFRLQLSDVNITEIDTNITNPDYLVKGSADINQNATYYYARTRASKFFYDDINTSSAQTPILINVYCDPSVMNCSNLDLLFDTDETGWWLSVDHNITNGDGNVTLQEGIILEGNSDNWSVTPDVNNIVNGEDENISVSRGTTNLVLPLTVAIDLVDTANPNDTSKWLIYNKDTDAILQAPPSPFYKVRFITLPADWAGQGDTGHVVESNASMIKNRRLGW